MAVLPQPKHEKMARLLAEDLDPATAYARAGFTPSKGAAVILSRRPHIVDRVDEIRAETQSNLRIEGEDDAPLDDEESIENIEVTRVWLLRQLTDNVVKSKRAGQFSASNKAIEMLGAYLGDMFGKNNRGPVDPAAAAALSNPREAVNALMNLANLMEQQEKEEAPVMKDVSPKKEEEKHVSGSRRTRKNSEDGQAS